MLTDLPGLAAPIFFLQPHHDDVALSCGGAVAHFAALGHETHVVTVFASELVLAMVGEFAMRKHLRWSIEDAESVTDVRRVEDLAAAEVLGARLRWLGLPDGIYRGDRYNSDRALFGTIHADELELAAAGVSVFAYEDCPYAIHTPLARLIYRAPGLGLANVA